jgi:hypothetical protein
VGNIGKFAINDTKAALRGMGFTWNKKLQTFTLHDEKDSTIHVYVDECESVFVFLRDTNIKETIREAKDDAKKAVKSRGMDSGLDVYDIYFDLLMNQCEFYYSVDAEGTYGAMQAHMQKFYDDESIPTPSRIERDISNYFDAGTGMTKKAVDDLTFVKEAIKKAGTNDR